MQAPPQQAALCQPPGEGQATRLACVLSAMATNLASACVHGNEEISKQSQAQKKPYRPMILPAVQPQEEGDSLSLEAAMRSKAVAVRLFQHKLQKGMVCLARTGVSICHRLPLAMSNRDKIPLQAQEWQHLCSSISSQQAARRWRQLAQHAQTAALAGAARRGQAGKLTTGIQAVHRQAQIEARERKEQAVRQRIHLLKNSDMEAYLALVKESKNQRLNEMLSQTDACLRSFASKLGLGSLGDTAAVQAPASTAAAGGSVDCLKEHSDGWGRLTSKIFADYVQSQPEGLTGGQLRDYQMHGLRWLVGLSDHGLNGILADDMGLGKTIQVIAMLVHFVEVSKKAGPFLIAAPSSVLPNWRSELQSWAPSLKVVEYRGSPEARQKIFEQQILGRGTDGCPKFQVLLTTYEMLMGKHDRPRLSRISYQMLIIDEGHRLKNSGCKLNTELRFYKTKSKLLLTGTPLQNNLEELWSLLNFLMPTLFSSSDDFNQWFATPLEALRCQDGSGSDAEAVALSQEEFMLVTNRLHQVLRPFMLRRLKSSVAAELPSKTEHILRCSMSPYQAALSSMVTKSLTADAPLSEGQTQAVMLKSVNNTLMELRNICNHPFISSLHCPHSELDLPSDHLPPVITLCSKMDLLDRLLLKLHKRKHKCLVFCTMTRLLDVMEELLDWRGYSYLRLDGSTPSAERASLIREFNDPASGIFIFLLSLRAGGVGLNLQAADTVIFYDTDFNPAMDDQAAARAHRIGQTNQVLVLRLVTSDTVEEHIVKAADEKRKFADGSITGGFFDGKTSAEERRQYLLSIVSQQQIGSGSKSPAGASLTDERIDQILARDGGKQRPGTNAGDGSGGLVAGAVEDGGGTGAARQPDDGVGKPTSALAALSTSRCLSRAACQGLIDAAVEANKVKDPDQGKVFGKGMRTVNAAVGRAPSPPPRPAATCGVRARRASSAPPRPPAATIQSQAAPIPPAANRRPQQEPTPPRPPAATIQPQPASVPPAANRQPQQEPTPPRPPAATIQHQPASVPPAANRQPQQEPTPPRPPAATIQHQPASVPPAAIRQPQQEPTPPRPPAATIQAAPIVVIPQIPPSAIPLVPPAANHQPQQEPTLLCPPAASQQPQAAPTSPADAHQPQQTLAPPHPPAATCQPQAELSPPPLSATTCQPKAAPGPPHPPAATRQPLTAFAAVGRQRDAGTRQLRSGALASPPDPVLSNRQQAAPPTPTPPTPAGTEAADLVLQLLWSARAAGPDLPEHSVNHAEALGASSGAVKGSTGCTGAVQAIDGRASKPFLPARESMATTGKVEDGSASDRHHKKDDAQQVPAVRKKKGGEMQLLLDEACAPAAAPPLTLEPQRTSRRQDPAQVQMPSAALNQKQGILNAAAATAAPPQLPQAATSSPALRTKPELEGLFPATTAAAVTHQQPGGGAECVLDAGLVDKRVEVWWPEDKAFYRGTVTSYRPKLRRPFCVRYDDGEEEQLDLAKQTWRLLQVLGSTATQQCPEPSPSPMRDPTAASSRQHAPLLPSLPASLERSSAVKSSDAVELVDAVPPGSVKACAAAVLSKRHRRPEDELQQPHDAVGELKGADQQQVLPVRKKKRSEMQLLLDEAHAPAASSSPAPEPLHGPRRQDPAAPAHELNAAPSQEQGLASAAAAAGAPVPLPQLAASSPALLCSQPELDGPSSATPAPAAAATAHRQPEGGAECVLDAGLVDKRIEVWWPEDKAFYRGTITSYRPKLRRPFCVRYDDGEEEQLDLAKQTWRLLQAPRSTATQQCSEPSPSPMRDPAAASSRQHAPVLPASLAAAKSPEARELVEAVCSGSGAAAALNKRHIHPEDELQQPHDSLEERKGADHHLNAKAQQVLPVRKKKRSEMQLLLDEACAPAVSSPSAPQPQRISRRQDSAEQDQGLGKAAAGALPQLPQPASSSPALHSQPELEGPSPATAAAPVAAATAQRQPEGGAECVLDAGLVDKRVEVWWPEDKAFYRGTITSYHPKLRRPFCVRYDDGEEEQLDLAKQTWRLLQVPRSTATQQCPEPSPSPMRDPTAASSRQHAPMLPSLPASMERSSAVKPPEARVLVDAVPSDSGKAAAAAARDKRPRRSEDELQQPHDAVGELKGADNHLNAQAQQQQVLPVRKKKRSEMQLLLDEACAPAASSPSAPEPQRISRRQDPAEQDLGKAAAGALPQLPQPACSPPALHSQTELEGPSPAAAAAHRQPAGGAECVLDAGLVDKRVEVWWPEDKAFYRGTVTSYRPKLRRPFCVRYDDGEEERLDLAKQTWRLLQVPCSTATQQCPEPSPSPMRDPTAASSRQHAPLLPSLPASLAAVKSPGVRKLVDDVRSGSGKAAAAAARDKRPRRPEDELQQPHDAVGELKGADHHLNAEAQQQQVLPVGKKKRVSGMQLLLDAIAAQEPAASSPSAVEAQRTPRRQDPAARAQAPSAALNQEQDCSNAAAATTAPPQGLQPAASSPALHSRLELEGPSPAAAEKQQGAVNAPAGAKVSCPACAGRHRAHTCEKRATAKGGVEHVLDAGLVDKRVEVWWPEDKAFYRGTVISYRPKLKLPFCIRYDDGEEEQLDLAKQTWRVSK